MCVCVRGCVSESGYAREGGCGCVCVCVCVRVDVCAFLFILIVVIILILLFIFVFFSIGFLNPSLYLYAEAMKAQDNKQQPSSSSSSSSSSSHTSSHSSHSSTPSDYDTPIESFYRDVASGDNKCLKDPYEYCCLQGFNAMEGWDPVSGIISYCLILEFFCYLYFIITCSLFTE